GPLAQRLRDSRDELTTRWLERIAARVTVERNRVFPADDLLDHVPLLIGGIADYVECPAEEIAAHMPVVAKAMELGELRHSQGFDAYEIFKEYELLGGVLFSFLATVVDEIDEPCTRAELLRCAHRVFRAVAIIQQVTTMHFLRMTGEQVREREGRLRAFNRMVSHELKNRLGAVQGAHSLLRELWIEEPQRERFLAMIGENVQGMHAVLEDLIALSRLEASARQQKNVVLPRAAAEVVRQLRRLAHSRGVTVRIAPDLPVVEVNAAVVELCLTNYVSNAIKYSDPSKAERWVEIRGRIQSGPADGSATELVAEVWDNGLGVPPDAQGKLFERFFRAHEAVANDVEGTGLGLSIVREMVETLGGRAWLQPNPDGGSVFAFAVPCRRRADSPSASESRRASPSSTLASPAPPRDSAS
ncbi:MAG: sensor histidine kinase, partial [Gemmatimonadota bacterium]|nr:sensor histidine kinase [Gemmatimonadota bacterium]